MKNKRGSHVEIVLSFVLFVSSVFFIYFLLEPSVNKNEKPTEIQSITKKIENFSLVNLTSISISIKIPPPNCVKLKKFFSTSGGINGKLISVGDSGKLETKKSGENLFVDLNGEDFFRVYISEEFEEKNGDLNGCNNLEERTDYTFGIIKKEEYFFENKILSLIQKHSTNYSGLKKDLKIPENVNFGMKFVYKNGTIVSSQDEILDVNVYSEEIPWVYVNKNLGVELGKLVVRVW